MTDAGAPPAGEMPTPDMTTPPEPAEPTLSPAERQKLEVFRQEHPDAEPTEQGGPGGEMPSRGMND
jgi:hypothetical protein